MTLAPTLSIIRSLLMTSALLMGVFLQAQSTTRLLISGDSLLALEKPQRAMDFFDRAVAKDHSAQAYLGRARAWYMMDRMDRFLQDVEKALKLDTTSAEAHYQRGLYAMRANDHFQAEYHAGKSVSHATDDRSRRRANLLRGEALAELKRNQQAIEAFEAGMDGGPNDVLAMRTLARLYDGAGRHADALGILERLCVIEPGDVGHWTNRGYELIMLERYNDALPMIEEALSIDKDEPVALSNRAYIYMKLDRDKEAWTDIESSLRSFPSNGHALRTRAMLRLRKGERDKACEDLGLAKALGEVPEVDQLIKENCASIPPPKKR